MPDGSSFEFSDKKENSSYNDGTTDNFGGSPSITAAYEDSISRSNQKSNTLSRKNNEQNVNSSYEKLYKLKDINAGSKWNNKENSVKVLNYDTKDDIMKENQSIGSELNGYEQNHSSRELGWNGNFGEDERPGRMVSMGHIQQKTSDTPRTKRIHRSGVSAEVLTSSGLTAEQAMLRAQSELEGFSTEFYTDAKYGGVKKITPFNTEHTIYYPDSAFERIGISVKNGVASFTEKRFNALVEKFSVPVGGQHNRDCALGYVAYISPSDFLSLTATNEQQIVYETKTGEKYGNGKLDIKILSGETQTPFLEINFDDGVVTGHEGRHRMVMLRDAGIDKVAIVVMSKNPEKEKYHTKKMTNVSVTGQEDIRGKAPGKVNISEIIPLSPRYRNEVREKFVDDSSDIMYSLKKNPQSGSQTNSIYDYTKSFSEQIDDWMQGKIPVYDTLLVGGTPDVLKNIGFNSLPVTINQTHVDYAINGTKDIDHHLGESLLKQLPDKIKEPIAVIESKTHPDKSVVALLDFRHNGKTIVVPVEIDGYGRINNVIIDSNAISSIFGKTNAIKNLLYGAVQDESIGQKSMFYWNKKEALSLLQKAGLQLPSVLPQDGFIHSIRENGAKVNTKFENVTQTIQFKRWFGDWENKRGRVSKIVDENGKPKIMYHGSPNEFAVFDISKSKYASTFSKGFYFTDSASHAGTYRNNGKVYQVYLNIKNPVDSDTKVNIRELKRFIEAVAENEDYSIENYGTYDVNEIISKVNKDNLFTALRDINSTAIGDYVEAVKLYNEVNGTDFDGIVSDSETVAFYPEQIKSATDNIGTFDGNNPDIRYSLKAPAKNFSDISDEEFEWLDRIKRSIPPERWHWLTDAWTYTENDIRYAIKDLSWIFDEPSRKTKDKENKKMPIFTREKDENFKRAQIIQRILGTPEEKKEEKTEVLPQYLPDEEFEEYIRRIMNTE